MTTSTLNAEQLTVKDLIDQFELMRESKVQATNRAVILKHGTFGNRTKHFLDIYGKGITNAKHLNFELAYTLCAYLEHKGFLLSKVDRRRILDNASRIVSSYLARKNS